MIQQAKAARRQDDGWAAYLFILPWILGFLLLTLYPILRSFQLSFTDYSLLSKPVWVGLRNYIDILTGDRDFSKSLSVTATFVIIGVPVRLFMSLMVAMLLNQKLAMMPLYRTMFYFPSLIGGSVAVATLWRNMFGLEGYVNRILAGFGIQGLGWITNPKTALGTLILLYAWQFGSTMVIFLAGLKHIPVELYESAEIDGAGWWSKFRSVTLPMLSPIIFFNLLMGIINAFQMFTSAFIITNGGPAHATYTYSLFLYEKAFTRYQMGYASALAWIMLLIVGVVTAVNFYLSDKWVFYETGGGK
jgi:multiple sugar transport system permease protein